MENKEKKGIFGRIYDWFKNLTVKGLLGAIFIAFVIIILLMSVSYLPSAISRLSSSFSAALYSIFVPAEGATMTVDKKVINSGEDFTINFKAGDKTNGIFTVSYTCDQNATLLAVESSGLKNIACDKPYYILNNDNSLKIKVNTKDESIVRLVVTGAIENNETQKSETVGVARITVANEKANPTVATPSTTKPTNSIVSNLFPNSSYVGKADLAVRVLQVGILNTNTNTIYSQNQFNSRDTVGVRFEVRNDGDAITNSWNFTASLPSASNPVYVSPIQNALRPGESIQFTLGFGNLTNRSNSLITINVDPSNLTLESNEANNMTTSSIINNGYNNNYYNNSNSGCYINGWFTYNCDNYSNSNGIDLDVEILAVGRLNSSGNFVEDDNVNEGDDVAVKFRIRNEGDEDSGRFDYEVNLTPSFSGDPYIKRNASSLDAGESVTVVVDFENARDTGTNKFKVEIDPDNDLNEDNTDNNTDTDTIYID